MSPDGNSTIETDLKIIEKLCELGNYEEARVIASRLILARSLSDDEKRRIKKVIDATSTKSSALSVMVIIILFLVLLYLYVQYVA